MIASVRQGLLDEGVDVPLSRLCRWFEVPRRTMYYRPRRKPAVVQDRFAQPIKALGMKTPRQTYLLNNQP